MSRANTNKILIRPVDRVIENASVTGTYDLDYSLYEVWNLTLTGNTTLTESNLPASGTNSKIIVLWVSGNYTLSYPAGWEDNITGEYAGTSNNLIVVQFFKTGTYRIHITQPE